MLTLVRHGRTEPNASGLLLGRADPPLDEVGRAQAAALGAVLGIGEPAPAVVVTSPLLRARQTAEAIASVARCPVRVDERWIELDYGELDLRRAGDVPRGTWESWRADPTFAPPGGESLAALGQRVRGACAALAQTAVESGDHVVVVSHVSPIKAAVAWVLDAGDAAAWRLYVAPASVTRIDLVGDGRAVLHSFNETAHLATLG